MAGHRTSLATQDGALDCYLFEPAGDGPWPAVILYMDAFGIRPHLDQMAQRLASNGYVVAVPNLYHRTPYEPFDPAKVATDGPERDRFRAMIGSIDGVKVMRDTAAVLEYLRRHPSVREGPVATVGYCMGGGYALRAAGEFAGQVAAAASFHGGSLATDRPDSPHLLAPRIQARVLVGVAAIDPTFSAEQRHRLEAALRDAGVRYDVEVYDGARHGFAVDGHLAYDREASERHWQRLIDLLGSTL